MVHIKKRRREPPPDDPTDGGRLCGSKKLSVSRTGKIKYCRNPAGFKTRHPGQGRCLKHGGRTQGNNLFVHPYETIVHERLAERYTLLAQAEYNVLDLIPEANLLRVLIVDFINRYESVTEALLRWYRGDTNTKPRRVMDISDASRMIEGLSKVIERIHKMRQEGAISLETFRRVTEAMGITVAKYVSDPHVLGDIEREWNTIAIDAKRPDPRPPDDGVEETKTYEGSEDLPDEPEETDEPE